MAGIVTLTTDFGLRDAYVAEMKGVMLGIARGARQSLDLVDVTHEVERHDITEGALALEAAAPFFPSGTVHLAVVDPGVGTARRGLAVAADGHVFVGPDNGLFTPFLDGFDEVRLTITGVPRRARSSVAALPSRTAISSRPVEPTSAPGRPTDRSA